MFGAENFLATFIWRTDGNLDNQAIIKPNHEFILMYGKRSDAVAVSGVKDPNLDDSSKLFNSEIRNSVVKNGPKNPESSIRLPAGFPAGFEEGIIQARTDAFPKYAESLIVADWKLTNPVDATTGWANAALLRQYIAGGFAPVVDSKGQETSFELTTTGAIENVKRRREDQHHILTVLMNMGTVETAANALAEWGISFAYPKPVPLIRYLLSFGPKEGLFVDFFAGSGTSGQAIMELNASDNGNRRYLLVQLDEPMLRGEHETVSAGMRERLRQAGIPIRAGHPDVDTGFRSYRLASPNVVPWDGTGEIDLLAAIENVREDRTGEDLLVEMMLRLGIDLITPIEHRAVAGSWLYSVGGSIYAYFGDGIDNRAADEIARAIIDWRNEDPVDSDVTVVVRDNGFTSSSAKLNLHKALIQAGFSNKSLRSI